MLSAQPAYRRLAFVWLTFRFFALGSRNLSIDCFLGSCLSLCCPCAAEADDCRVEAFHALGDPAEPGIPRGWGSGLHALSGADSPRSDQRQPAGGGQLASQGERPGGTSHISWGGA